jgi:hypothetical protein
MTEFISVSGPQTSYSHSKVLSLGSRLVQGMKSNTGPWQLHWQSTTIDESSSMIFHCFVIALRATASCLISLTVSYHIDRLL